MFKVTFSEGHVEISCENDSSCKPRYRRKKGASLLLIPSDYTVVDIEATGHNAGFDSIIEVCCIKCRNNKEVDRFSTLIQPPPVDVIDNGNPEYERDEDLEYVDGIAYVDSFVTDFTGITNQMLSTAPKFADIADDLWSFMRDEILVGHNVNFDINFLYDNFISLDENRILRNDYVDTLRLARKVLPDLNHHRLEDLDGYFDIGNKHHRSVDDCLTTNIVLHRLADNKKEKGIRLDSTGYQVNKIDMRNIKAETSNFDTSHPFYDKHCVFTGTLEQFSRKDAAQIVANLGGHCDNGVTKKTNFLVVGDFDYRSGVKEGKSNKIKKAEHLILQGQDLQILSESTFCEIIVDSAQ